MILDHICYQEESDPRIGKITIRASYHLDCESITSLGGNGMIYDEIKVELAKQIQKEMIKDLSGYFHDSFDEKDVEYVATISHRQLEDMRKLAELTKWMTIDEVEKALRTYEVLKDFAAMFKRE